VFDDDMKKNIMPQDYIFIFGLGSFSFSKKLLVKCASHRLDDEDITLASCAKITHLFLV